MTKEWDGDSYHRLSVPQTRWGEEVLRRLPLAGHETVLDGGCGTGKLTAQLAARLPRGRVVGLDRSLHMLRVAAGHLPSRAVLVRADLLALPLPPIFDAVFSSATFHWVLDHPRLFRGLREVLRPGGRLVAQCGGGANVAGFLAAVRPVMADRPFAPWFAGFEDPWEFADAPTTAARLEAAGFVDVATSVEPAPIMLTDPAEARAFVETAVLRVHTGRLPDGLRGAFVDQVMAGAGTPLVLDYHRLNMEARARSPG